ncbi:MCE family protein [Gordonia pseudamarae]|uniref:MCE family protein n=1 Tax=Gordonia pseudamarae TaxID=2831662 RepID=A0ABX6IKT4_9ACTN|nr:MCE family protein [Gordonia sp. (in: high G+C Gram-positive bacteria)]MBD0021261.1 MCE family protein [Gordonia sp. (in: high G+C Gram-positive bacteria)]QHN27622.1 MCE family protein [Gordonia pseudamarae]QHN36504.1 MCE family protein [Gordonia pseudamarae]
MRKLTHENTPAAGAAQPKKSRRFAGRRNPVSIGGIGILVVLMVAISAFFLNELPLLGAGARYSAEFSEAAGLKKGNEVRVAGIKVGEVDNVELDGDRVKVTFRANNTWIGDRTEASIQIKTVLGQKYLALTPLGDKLADPDTPIPLDRTVSPYDVIEAFSDASTQLTGDPNTGESGIDSKQLAQSFNALSDSLSGTAGNFAPTLDGLSRLSETIASRDSEVKRLLSATKNTTKILADRNEEFTRLIAGAGELLQELNNRQKSITRLLATTTSLSNSLTGLVRDNEKQIGPALDALAETNKLLQRQNQNIRDTIKYMAPFYRLYGNVLGNGRWLESVVTNILPPALPQQNTTRPPNKQAMQNNGGTEAG